MSRQLEMIFSQPENSDSSSSVATDLFSSDEAVNMNMDIEESSPTIKITADVCDEKNDIFAD